MAASSRIALAAAVACGGCDLAFGLSGAPDPCSLDAFDEARTTEIAQADDFSIDWDQTYVVYSKTGLSFEMTLPAGAPEPIDLGPYPMVGMSLTPEGNALFYTAVVEPPLLRGALRAGEAQWQLDAGTPKGTFAGTPSADVFGPRRVIVRLRASDPDVLEYEDDNGRWITVGEPHRFDGQLAANLTPNGLTMVYSGLDAEHQPAVFAATRTSTAEWFGEPAIILHGDHRSPQLLGQCKRLYAISDSAVLRRFEK